MVTVSYQNYLKQKLAVKTLEQLGPAYGEPLAATDLGHDAEDAGVGDARGGGLVEPSDVGRRHVGTANRCSIL